MTAHNLNNGATRPSAATESGSMRRNDQVGDLMSSNTVESDRPAAEIATGTVDVARFTLADLAGTGVESVKPCTFEWCPRAEHPFVTPSVDRPEWQREHTLTFPAEDNRSVTVTVFETVSFDSSWSLIDPVVSITGTDTQWMEGEAALDLLDQLGEAMAAVRRIYNWWDTHVTPACPEWCRLPERHEFTPTDTGGVWARVHYRSVDPDDTVFGEFSQRETLTDGRVNREPETFRIGARVLSGPEEIRAFTAEFTQAAEDYAAEHGIKARA
jgi:hypothetical protein